MSNLVWFGIAVHSRFINFVQKGHQHSGAVNINAVVDHDNRIKIIIVILVIAWRRMNETWRNLLPFLLQEPCSLQEIKWQVEIIGTSIALSEAHIRQFSFSSRSIFIPLEIGENIVRCYKSQPQHKELHPFSSFCVIILSNGQTNTDDKEYITLFTLTLYLLH